MKHLVKGPGLEDVVDDFVSEAARNKISKPVFDSKVTACAALSDMSSDAFVAEVQRQVKSGRYNDVMLISMPSWIRPHLGLAA